MAEHRPYRVTNRRIQAQLAQIKLISVASFLTVALAINWVVTERAAAIFGYSPLLGPRAHRPTLRAVGVDRVVGALAHHAGILASVANMCPRGRATTSDRSSACGRCDPPRTLDAQRRNPRPPRLGEMGEHARHPDRRGRINGKDLRCGVEIRAPTRNSPTPEVPRIRLLEKAES
jgi:hypothetical protein